MLLLEVAMEVFAKVGREGVEFGMAQSGEQARAASLDT